MIITEKEESATTRSAKNSTTVNRNLFNGNTTNVAAPKAYITQQEMMSRTRSQKRKKVMHTKW